MLDTTVLLHCFDDRDPAKRDAARGWVGACWTRRCGRISGQVLNEFYNNARRKFATAISAGDARAEVRRYQHWKPWQTDHPTVETAWAIESRFGLNYWDALVVAAAQHQGCRYLLTDDLQHGLQIDSVQILNPFLVGPAVLDEPVPKA
jgi:predicted nucleic acid-binding protein